jgi:DNA-binding MarR family transcriptional regulator
VSQDLAPAGTLQVWGALQQAYVLVARYLESVTAGFGLSYPQTAVLAVLHHSDRPLPLSHIARLLTQEAQSTTELADRLERRGFVMRIRDTRDRRLVLLDLTGQGRGVIEQILPALEEAGSQIFGVLTSDQLGRLQEHLDRVRERAATRLGGDRVRGRAADGAKPATE